jgi:endonuclease/exonuclease/phosphatase (EEP) superfamily protein YafD
VKERGAISGFWGLWQFLAGLCTAFGLLALVMGSVLRLVPNSTPISAIARSFDSLSPWFLALSLLAGLLVALLGRRWLGAGLVLASLGAASHLWSDHRAFSLPLAPELTSDLRVIFFNMYGDNAAYADRIVTAVIEADADVLVIAEGEGLHPALARLREAYKFVSPCAYEDCELIVASKRDPLRFWTLSLNAAWDDRYGVAELTTRTGKGYFLAASHSVKPWLSGIAESEQVRLAAQYNWLSGPVVAVGDFNAAPWGYSMRNVLKPSGMKALRWPVPTWPAGAGALGVPIDHILVRGGARVVAVQPFGPDLNSNHRGLLAEIALP